MLYVSKIYILTLLKISYEVGICLMVSLLIMALITYLKGDKAYFRRKINKFIKE